MQIPNTGLSLYSCLTEFVCVFGRNYERGEEEETAESCTSLMEQRDWWWEHIQVTRARIFKRLWSPGIDS